MQAATATVSALSAGAAPFQTRSDSDQVNSGEPIRQRRDQARNGEPVANRGRGGRAKLARDAILAMRPASVAPQSPSSASSTNPTDHKSTSKANRGKGQSGRLSRAVGDRRFGGHLTTEQNPTALQADVPDFVPDASLTSSKPQSVHPRKQRRLSKSTAPDIATRIHEDIDNKQYECAICTNEVLRNSKVWSCRTCWTVFHLSCVKKWSANQISTAQQQPTVEGALPPLKQWRCPGCNLPKDVSPSLYTCWCGKEQAPRVVVGIPPHSCGNTCGRDRVRKCPHPCQLTCHAGPCPPCTYMGPTQSCFCGKHDITKKCVDTDYDSGWSCGDACADLLPCGEHLCTRPCHEGLCGACEEMVDAQCYCGKVAKTMPCGDRQEPKLSQKCPPPTDSSQIENWTGTFTCTKTCGRSFDCGAHSCERGCHQQDAQPAHCPLSVDVVITCPCGKTALSDLLESPRTQCTDMIPNCKEQCDKILICGNSCEKVCHAGQCPSCTQVTDITCRCGRTTTKTLCHQGDTQPPQCPRVCRAQLSCARHACDERCCSGERKAAERLSTRKKHRPIDAAPLVLQESGIEAEHICTRICGRLLKCGNHNCEELCHKGPCRSCPEAIFYEISCHCGKTILQPPLPCGTEPPPCRFPCNRPKSCGHAQVAHSCHTDDESCPKCPFLVDRRCMCGRNVLKHQQCWLQDVRCGSVCGKPLKCGSHFCQKQCHKPGECEDAGATCRQACGKPKAHCGHPDESPCHAPYACKEDKPCGSKIIVTCPCQAQKQSIKCCAFRDSEGNASKSLTCNEECARLERNRKLALALNLDPSTHVTGGDHVPYSEETLNLYRQHPKWCQTQEREFRVFVIDDDEKRLRFKPMPSSQRSFIHSLAEDFGLDSESMDPEPHRHVAIFKTPRFVAPPSKTLSDSARIRMQQQALAGKEAAEAKQQQQQKASHDPFDAYVIASPRFGLTSEEVQAALLIGTKGSSAPPFDITFLPNDEVLLKPRQTPALAPKDLASLLQALKPALGTAITTASIGRLELCLTDPATGTTIRSRESDFPSATALAEGWSRVAAKGAAPRRALASSASPSGAGNTFWALGGNKVTFTKAVASPKVARKKAEVVVDDWEAAAAELESEEAATASGAAGVQGKTAEGEKVDSVGSVPDHQAMTDAGQNVDDVGPSLDHGDVKTHQAVGTHLAASGVDAVSESSASGQTRQSRDPAEPTKDE